MYSSPLHLRHEKKPDQAPALPKHSRKTQNPRRLPNPKTQNPPQKSRYNQNSPMDITLREITADNWQTCIALRVSKKQIPYIPSNIFSLAESKFLPDRVPLGIYDAEDM